MTCHENICKEFHVTIAKCFSSSLYVVIKKFISTGSAHFNIHAWSSLFSAKPQIFLIIKFTFTSRYSYKNPWQIIYWMKFSNRWPYRCRPMDNKCILLKFPLFCKELIFQRPHHHNNYRDTTPGSVWSPQWCGQWHNLRPQGQYGHVQHFKVIYIFTEIIEQGCTIPGFASTPVIRISFLATITSLTSHPNMEYPWPSIQAHDKAYWSSHICTFLSQFIVEYM